MSHAAARDADGCRLTVTEPAMGERAGTLTRGWQSARPRSLPRRRTHARTHARTCCITLELWSRQRPQQVSSARMAVWARVRRLNLAVSAVGTPPERRAAALPPGLERSNASPRSRTPPTPSTTTRPAAPLPPCFTNSASSDKTANSPMEEPVAGIVSEEEAQETGQAADDDSPAAPTSTSSVRKTFKSVVSAVEVANRMADHERFLKPPLAKNADGTNGELWVDIRMNLQLLSKIDTVTSTAQVRIDVVMYWNDPRLCGWDEEEDLPGTLWGPRLRARGGETLSEQDNSFNIIDYEKGRCKRSRAYVILLDNLMDLHHFPFDMDDVELLFVTTSDWCTYDNGRIGSLA
eukprot:COSAG02_NODE_13637_length_1368_cov_2.997955_1_plen_348_part_10